MKTIHVKIKGISPLLINRFSEEAEEPVKTRRGKKDYGTSRAQAEKTAYCDARSKKLWVPTTWITGTIRSIASDYKLPGTRKSVKSVAGGVIVPTDEKAYFEEDYKLQDIEVDSRPVVIQRARIMRHRAKLESWSLSFNLQIDEEILPLDDVHQILNDSGRRSGIGDFRPQKGGPFGRFNIVKWKEVKNK